MPTNDEPTEDQDLTQDAEAVETESHPQGNQPVVQDNDDDDDDLDDEPLAAPKSQTPGKRPVPGPIVSDTAQLVIDEMAKHLGVSSQDIDLDASLTEDLELSRVELEDLLQYLAQRFAISFEDLAHGSFKTVNELVETIEDLSLE